MPDHNDQPVLGDTPMLLSPPTVRQLDDHGAVGKGYCQARFCLADDGKEYILKGPAFSPNHPYVAANELVAASIGKVLQYPVLDYVIVYRDSEPFFGSTRLRGRFYDMVDSAIWQASCTQDCAYQMVVFDSLIVNGDRHHGNLLAKVSYQNTDSFEILFNDHSHCLIGPGENATDLSQKADCPVSICVTLDFVREHISESEQLRSCLDRAATLRPEVLTEIVGSVPQQWLTREEGSLVVEFLLDRQSRLRRLFEEARNHFPRLDGGSL